MAAGSPRILVVDDEPAIVEGLCEALELMGYQVQTAFNGQQALEAVDSERMNARCTPRWTSKRK